MYNNYPNYYPQVQQPRPQMIGLKGRPVSSIDEVKDYITEAFGDLNAYLNTQIEAAVNGTKMLPVT